MSSVTTDKHIWYRALSRDCVCRYIGGWPSSQRWMPPGNPSIVDCTCELPRRHNNTYLCLPTWDTHGVCRSHVAGACITSLTNIVCILCHTVARMLPHTAGTATSYRFCRQLSIAITLATTASCHTKASPCLPCSTFELQVRPADMLTHACSHAVSAGRTIVNASISCNLLACDLQAQLYSW